MPQNAYFDGAWRYGANGFATRYAQEAGVHQWWNAPSGTAGNAVTFTQAMTLEADGDLALGKTSAGYRFDLQGAAGENQTLAGFFSGTNTSRGLTIGLSAGGTGVNDAFAVYNATITGGYAGHIWQAGGTERARIDASGNLLVGTTTASSKLCVNAEMSLLTDGNNRGIIGWDNSLKRLSFGTINASTAYFDSMSLRDGNLIVGDTATSVTGERVSIRNNSGPQLILRSTGDPTMRFYNTTDNASTSCQINYYSGTAFSIETIPALPIVFLTTNTERLRIPAAGGVQAVTTISVGNATPSSSGAGITFPATQSASSNANTLDDYEEGTWTPALGGFSSITYSAQTGTYTKIGNVVNVVCKMVVTGGTRTSADLQVFSLPFTSASQENSGGSWGYGYGVVASSVGLPQLRINASATTVSLLNTAGGVLAGTDLNTATPTINFSATYTV